MHDMLDPIADNIFDATGSSITKTGAREWRPESDDDWAKVRIGAVTIAEGAYLLKIPRPLVPPGDKTTGSARDRGELPPDDILAKIERDPVLWQAKIEALRNVGREVLALVDTRNAAGLVDASEDLDAACENCHLEFWYPNQKELMPKLDQELREFSLERERKRQ